MYRRSRWCGWYLTLALLGLPAVAAAVTIYRFGGADLPPPAEAGQPGVVFRQLSWETVGNGGELYGLDAGPEGIAPYQTYAFAPLPLRDHNPQLSALFDWYALTCGVCQLLTAPSYRCGNSVCRGLYGDQGTINISLGNALFVEKVRIRSGATNGLGIVENFGLYLSPLPLASNAGPQVPFTIEVKGNQKAFLDITGFSQERRTTAIQLALPEHEAPVYLAEVFVFASGVAARGLFTSEIIDFGGPALWGGLRWSLRQAAESSIFLQTRNGESLDQFRYWQYTGIGDQRRQVNKVEYDQLRTSQQAGLTYNYDNWNPWTAHFDLTRRTQEPPIFPWPRRAFQFQFEFLSPGEEGSQIEFLEFRASAPFVSEVVGELEPIEVQAGVSTRFTYALKPRLQEGDPGFDRLEIRAVATRLITVQQIYLNSVEVPFTVEELTDRYLVVGLTRVGRSHSDSIIEVVFDAQVLRYGGAFSGRLIDSRRPFDVPQPVLAGNALDDVDSEQLWIETTIAVESVLTAQAEPATFTPNGDGINDQVDITYSLFETIGAVAVAVEIWDLAGRRVRLVHAGVAGIGQYENQWDGRDDTGVLVPPGLYLYRVVAAIAQDRFADLGPLRVVY